MKDQLPSPLDTPELPAKASPDAVFPKNKLFTLAVTSILLILIITGLIYLQNKTPSQNQVVPVSQTPSQVTFTSTRARFSFKHPSDWPVTTASNEQLNNSNLTASTSGMLHIEDIDFNEEYVPNAGGPRLGFITVQQIVGINSLDDYISSINKDMSFDSVKGRINVPPPDITETTIGGERAILVKDKSTAADLSPNNVDYRLFKNGWVYRFVASSSERFLKNKEKNTAIFQTLISTVKFLDLNITPAVNLTITPPFSGPCPSGYVDYGVPLGCVTQEYWNQCQISHTCPQ